MAERKSATLALGLLLVGLAAGALAGSALKPGGIPAGDVDALKAKLADAEKDASLWRAVIGTYTLQPPPSMADHSVKDNGDGTVHFFHFNTPEKKELLFIGNGVMGNGCKSTQDKINAVNGGGYTHFHTLKTADGKSADVHGIPPGERGDRVQGAWFKHVAVRDVGTDHPMAAMFLGPSQKPLKAGDVAADFFPTPADTSC